MDVSLQDICLARKRIASIAWQTPLVHCPLLSGPSLMNRGARRAEWARAPAGTSVYLKLENLQETGSFKLRGAANKLMGLTAEERAHGVIAVSTGNHGRAVCFAAQSLGVHAVICLSEAVTSNKVESIRRLGAEVVIHGRSYDEAAEHARCLQRERGLAFVDPFDDPLVIAGQGTIGLELLEQLPELDTVVVPLSGGGLISGIALALKSTDPAIRVVGVSMDRAPVMVHSLRVGAPVELEEEKTLADALVGGIGSPNRYTFRLVQQWVDETVLVSEEEIAAAMAFAFEQHHLTVEGGGAVGIAALMNRRAGELGRHVAVIVSGGNVDTHLLSEIVREFGQGQGNAECRPPTAGGREQQGGDSGAIPRPGQS